jgi:hypothetical protein
MRKSRLGYLALLLGAGTFVMLVCAGVMRGAIFQAIFTPPADAAPAAAMSATSQCDPLPASASASASPSASASASDASAQPQLCVSVLASQASIDPGKTADWTVQVWAQGGSVPSVSVTLTTSPSGMSAEFNDACPSGGGAASCDLGDMGTPITPTSYQLPVQLTVPASASAGSLTLTATADSANDVYPAAGQTITINKPAPSPTPKQTHTTAAAAATAPTHATTTAPGQAATQPVYTPPATSDEPSLAPMPTGVGDGSTAGDTSSSLPLPVITGPDTPVTSTPAANIQSVPDPSSSSPQAGSFTLTIGMSSQTAEILGLVVLGLAIVLAATRLTGAHFARARQPVTPAGPPALPRPRHSRRLPRIRFARIRFPRMHVPTRQSRAARRVAREQNWQRHLESEHKELPPAPPPSANE